MMLARGRPIQPILSLKNFGTGAASSTMDSQVAVVDDLKVDPTKAFSAENMASDAARGVVLLVLGSVNAAIVTSDDTHNSLHSAMLLGLWPVRQSHSDSIHYTPTPVLQGRRRNTPPGCSWIARPRTH